MNLDKFTALVRDPSCSKEQLKTMFENARRKEARDHAAVVKDELDRRFPGWDAVKTRRGGAKPAIAMFKGAQHEFPTSREAYVWLVERFADAIPQFFDDPNEDTIYVAVGKQRNYFGRNLGKMFHATPKLADNPSNYAKLKNGWYVNLNLSNAQKFDILLRFGVIAKLEYLADWEWRVLDPTEALIDRRAGLARSKELLEELKGLGGRK